METNSRAAVRGLILILPSLSLTHFSFQEFQVPEIELVAIASTTKECTSVPVEDQVLQTLQTNSMAAVRGLIHILSSL